MERRGTRKLDGAALPAAAEVTAEVPGPYIAPTSDVQRALAKIWVELLGVERVGIHDDFFDLGGHSLLAFHLISRILVALGVEIPVRAVFDAPTVAGLEQAVIDADDRAAGVRTDRTDLARDAPVSASRRDRCATRREMSLGQDHATR